MTNDPTMVVTGLLSMALGCELAVTAWISARKREYPYMGLALVAAVGLLLVGLMAATTTVCRMPPTKPLFRTSSAPFVTSNLA